MASLANLGRYHLADEPPLPGRWHCFGMELFDERARLWKILPRFIDLPLRQLPCRRRPRLSLIQREPHDCDVPRVHAQACAVPRLVPEHGRDRATHGAADDLRSKSVLRYVAAIDQRLDD